MTVQKGKESVANKIIANKKKLFLGAMALIVVSAFVFLTFTLVKNSSDINRLQVQKQELVAQCDEQQEKNDELKAVLDSDNKDSYIEQKAREKGYAKSNEIVFYDISASE
ncbi:MAG: septum formation initiator family protein [Eubacterium sp.]